MMEFDATGYAAHRPVKPYQWQEFCPGIPGGIVISASGDIQGSLPPGFLIVQCHLDASVCDTIIRECDEQTGVQHTVSTLSDANGIDARETQGRTSEYIDIRTLRTDIKNIVRDTYTKTVAPHCSADMDWFELPEILRSKLGGEYRPHAGADYWSPAEMVWKREIDRDLSILVYLNEGYGGGEIAFPNFGVKLQPRRGRLIAFPSDRRYVHTALPVTSGIRYALVSWGAVNGGVRVADDPREHAVRM